MIFENRSRAEKYFSHINYYRLSAYALPFEKSHAPQRFKPGTRFDTILEHYIFDRQLRLLIMDAVERIEVSVRTQWAYYLAHIYGPHACLQKNIHVINGRWDYTSNLALLKKTTAESREDFIRHFDKYEEELPPVWVVSELMTLGQLSRWYKNLKKRKDRNKISAAYGLDESILTSFLHHLSIVRNVCAHHGRLWNREFTIIPKLPKLDILNESFNHEAKNKLYNTITLIAYIMDKINPNSWKQRLKSILLNHPDVDESNMGFPENWEKKPVWEN